MTRASSTLMIRSSWGSIEVAASNATLIACRLPFIDRVPGTPLIIADYKVEAGCTDDRTVLSAAFDFIKNLFAGRTSSHPPLARQAGSDFFQRIMAVLARIPSGRVITYGSLAAEAGYPGAARAAGSVCGANALPLFIPCHRVVAAGNKSGGFSAGMAWKNHLLAIETSAAGVRACA